MFVRSPPQPPSGLEEADGVGEAALRRVLAEHHDGLGRLAAGLDYWRSLALIGLTLAVTYVIVFEGGFAQAQSPAANRGPFQHPITETVLAYFVSLLVALITLYLFHQIRLDDSAGTTIARMLVAGMPIAVGGAAGRLVV